MKKKSRLKTNITIYYLTYFWLLGKICKSYQYKAYFLFFAICKSYLIFNELHINSLNNIKHIKKVWKCIYYISS